MIQFSHPSASMSPASREVTRAVALVCILGIATLCCAQAQAHGFDVMAQATPRKNPFNVGISEGGSAPQGGIAGWIWAQQIAFERMLSGAVRAIKSDASAFWTLLGISFAYGAFHAAGPGHGKAVVAAYMFANERALKRGIAISFIAALLQGLVAILIVGILAWLLNASSQTMKSAANFVEIASFAAIALLGVWLVWRKGRAFIETLQGARAAPALLTSAGAGAQAHQHHDHSGHHGHHEHKAHHDHQHHVHAHAPRAHAAHATSDLATFAEKHEPALAHTHAHTHAHDHAKAHDHPHHEHADPHHVHDAHCGHFHAPDPRTLGDGFSWGTAIATVFAAGSRPCSGAILVLVFALAQGIFLAGIAATLAMSLGTALTTGALAAGAVLAKGLAIRFLGEGNARTLVAVRTLELVAAMLVMLLGIILFVGSFGR